MAVKGENVNNSVSGSTAVAVEKSTPENIVRTTPEQQLNEEVGSGGDVAATQQETTPERNSSHERISSGEGRPVVAVSSASVGDEVVAVVTGADRGKENDVEEAQDASAETSPSGMKDSVSHADTREVSQETSPGEETAQQRNASEGSLSGRSNSKASLSGEKDTASYSNTSAVPTSNRNTSQVSLSGDKDTVSGQEQTARKGSMTVSEYFGAPSEEDINLSRQSVGASEQNITEVKLADEESPAEKDTSEGNLSSQRSTSKVSLSDEKDTASHSTPSADPASNRNASQVSLSNDKDAVPVEEETVRKDSMIVSEYFGAPSEEDVNLSRQNLGTTEQNILHSTTEVTLVDEETPEAMDTSEGNVSSHRSTSKASLSGEKDTASHSTPSVEPASNRNVSQASLPTDDNDTLSAQEETVRKDSMSHQSLGSSQQIILPSTPDVVLPLEPNETTKEDSASLEGKQVPAEQNVNFSLDGHHSPTRRDSTVNDENTQGRICTVTANVRIGSLEHSEGQRTVTLSGSVYRVPKEEGDPTTPNPGDRIGIVKGEVTTTPIDNESSEKLATLRGDLFTVSGDALANGLIATASIDVLSCNSGEKIATITADVAPSDDPEHQSGIITGEVLAGTENGSYDEKIGSLSGKVVALTFDEDIFSIGSLED